VVKKKTRRWHTLSAVLMLQSDLAGKSYVECTLTELVIWNSLAMIIIYNNGTVQTAATDQN
jgi:hypothetical protein